MLHKPDMKMTKAELFELLRRVENAMNQSPQENPWDLGPSDILQDVRRAIGMKPNPKKQR